MTDTNQGSGSKSDQAKAAASDTAGKAADQGKDVARSAASQASDVKEHAKQQAGTVVDEAKNQAQKVLSTTTNEVESQADQRLSDASSFARSTAGELRALAEGRHEDAGRTGDLAHQASERLERLADRADELGVRGVAEEAADLARRRPVAFLAGAVAAGFLVGRLARAGKEVQSSDSSSSSTSTSGTNPSSEPRRQRDLATSTGSPAGLSAGQTQPTTLGVVDPPVDGSSLGITTPTRGMQP